MWDWNFSHKQLPYGGSFIFYKESPNELTLEAVTFDGLWPQKFNETYFSDLKHYCPAQKSNNESDT